MTQTLKTALNWTEQGYVPDQVIRRGIRYLLGKRLEEISQYDCEKVAEDKEKFIELMQKEAIAVLPEKANEQHYEVPAAFFKTVLGPVGKYSCCYWPEGTKRLDQAEQVALQVTCEHADLKDGQRILELGCGWGSLTLWMARHYPNSHITAVSNSHSQREHIETQAQQMQLENLRVITCDMNDFTTEHRFDRIVSVEMFEHMRNWQQLYYQVSNWLEKDGKFFKHIFVHKSAPYLFEDASDEDWMSRHFFSGGMMPSDDLPLRFQHDLSLEKQWRWNGQHYEKTCNAWLENMDKEKDLVWPILNETYGEDQTQIWWMRWRIFFMSCAELFAYRNGQEWYVSHYLFSKR